MTGLGGNSSSPGIVLVVPCFNEAARLLPEAFLAFVEANPAVRLCFVDDGSTDRTWEQLEVLQATAPDSIEILRLPQNEGKAEAVRQGMLRAIDSGSRYAGFWDADLAAPLSESLAFAGLLDTRPALDAVLGSRVRLLGRLIERKALLHYTGRVFATAASLTLQLPVYDTQCGAKLFRVTPRLREVFSTRFLARWIFDVEIIARLEQSARAEPHYDLEAALYEYPLDEWRHQAGSKRRLGHLIRAAFDLWRIRAAHGTMIRARRMRKRLEIGT